MSKNGDRLNKITHELMDVIKRDLIRDMQNGKHKTSMTPEERQEVLLAIQAAWSAVVNVGDLLVKYDLR